MQHPKEGLKTLNRKSIQVHKHDEHFIDFSIQSETSPTNNFLFAHLQEQECDVYSHGDTWGGRVMAPRHALLLPSSDFVSLHVWRHCTGWEHSHSRLDFSSAAPRLRDLVSDVGAALRAASCEGGGCEIRFRNYLQRCSSQQGANLVKEAFTAKFTCYSKASRMPNCLIQ